MELRGDIRRDLNKFAEIQSRLRDFHAYAEREIQTALHGCLLLDPGLCTQAARCYDSVKASAAQIAEFRPVVLLSGPGAFATLVNSLLDVATCGCGDDPVAETAIAAAGFERLRGVLRLAHNPELSECAAKLRHRQQQRQGDQLVDDVREFVDWAAAGKWLAERSHAEAWDGDWELELRCPDLMRLQLIVAPLLGRSIRSNLHQYLPNCALFLHHVDFARESVEAADAGLRQAVELCVLMRTDKKQILILHSRLHFICGAEPEPGWQMSLTDLVDSALRDFMPDSAERRRRLVQVNGSSAREKIAELLARQLCDVGQGTLGHLLSDLCSVSRAVRGVRGRHLAEEASSNEQRRPPTKFTGDLERLQLSAKAAASSFQRSLEARLSELSTQIESHLRRQEVKDRLAAAFVGFRIQHPQLQRLELKQYLLELVSQELHNWNRETRIILELDRTIGKLKADHFQRLCRIAQRIPELVALPSESFSEPPPLESFAGLEDSLSSRTVISVGITQIGSHPMKRSFLQSLAVGIGMPLFVPLAAITMAFIWPVTFFRKAAGDSPAEAPTPSEPVSPIDKKAAKRIYDEAWDFFDKIGRQFIADNFFLPMRHFLKEDALKLEQFVDNYCILPQDLKMREKLLRDPKRLRGQLDEFQKRLQGLVAEAKLFGARELGLGMLPLEQCNRLGINCGADSELQLGDKIGGGSFSSVLALRTQQQQQQPPLALKLVHSNSTGSALLEAEMMRELSLDAHPNLLLGLGSVYFPALQQVGLLMPRCHCNLRQLLLKHRQLLVPVLAPPSNSDRALKTCIRLCHQILSGVRHLHGKRILHRDLKLENVLVDQSVSEDPGEARLKICDFGFAKEEEALSGRSFVGTVGYLAPELTPPNPRFSVKSDIYALGVMLWECYYGKSAPNVANSQIATMLNGDKGLDYLIQLMTHSLPQERPFIEQCLVQLTLREQQANRLVSFDDCLTMLSL